MFVRTQVAPESTEENSKFMANSFWKITCPINLELFQMTIEPPDTPWDGM
jgi:hypothetical protein